MSMPITSGANFIGSYLERDCLAQPAETFQTGIRKTMQWYLDNQGWVSDVQGGIYREWLNKHYGEQITV